VPPAAIRQLRQALRGRFGDHHGLLVGLALDHLEATIATLDGRIDRVLAPFAVARDRLDTITGVGKRAAERTIAEVGVDTSVFPPAGHRPGTRTAAGGGAARPRHPAGRRGAGGDGPGGPELLTRA
jgi:transposase